MKKLLFLALLLIAFACKKDDDANNLGAPKEIHLLTKTYLNDDLISERIYAADSTLIRINSYRSDTIYTYTEYEYIGDTIRRIYNSNSSVSNTYRDNYQLSDNKIKSILYNYGNIFSYAIYTFEGDDCGYSKYEYFNSDDVLSFYSTIAFTDENCSTSSLFYNEDSATQIRSAIKRDNEAVYIHSRLDDMLRTNNLGSTTQYRYWDEDEVLSEEFSYTAVIEYNDAGYPILNTQTFLDGDIKVYRYEY